jgi:hypothetical protein
MKNLFLATIAISAIGTMASADIAPNLSLIGSTEYHTTTKDFQANVGVDYKINKVEIVPVLTGLVDSNGNYRYGGSKITVSYEINSNLKPYVGWEKNNEYNYNYGIVGVAFKF